MTSESRQYLTNFVKENSIIVLYLLQLLFILIYSEPEVQPFVYVRF